jgi:hypothetical protein
MPDERLKIEVTVPLDGRDVLLQAMAEAGAGTLGEYHSCSFTVAGMGRFSATDRANPAVGRAGEATVVEEVCVQTWCSREQARTVVAAIRAAHPYEEPVIYLIPLLDEAAL